MGEVNRPGARCSPLTKPTSRTFSGRPQGAAANRSISPSCDNPTAPEFLPKVRFLSASGPGSWHPATVLYTVCCKHRGSRCLADTGLYDSLSNRGTLEQGVIRLQADG